MLSLIHADSGRHFTRSDVELAEELGRRAALAIEKARLYAELAARERRYAALIEHTWEAIALFSAEGLILYGSPWGFRSRDIKASVHVWHGDADTIVPLSMGEYQAKSIPGAEAHFCPGEGHFLVVPRVREILDVVAG